ncbi:MAG: glycosyltransferase [Verrucomicrobiia bacterium]
MVSVLMPVRNASETLERAIASISSQTLREWELIAVDDFSEDGSFAMLEGLAKTDPRIRPVKSKSRGIVPALNTGLELARGRFVARMDADDYSHPDRLETQAEFLAAHPQIGVVGCLVGFGGDRLRSAGFAVHVDWLNTLLSHEQISLNRFVESPLAHPSVMFRRKLPDRFGGYREGDFPEDYELWLRWLEAGVRIAKVQRELVIWHDSLKRLSRTDPRYRTEAFYKCKAEYIARWLHANVAMERRILVWGAGRETRLRAEHLTKHGVEINGYIDIDPKKQTRRFRDRAVIGPEALPIPNEVFVLGYVSKRGARELIRARLANAGYTEGRDFIMAA